MNLMARRRGVSQNLAERPPFASAAEPERPEARAQAIDFVLAMVDAGRRDEIAAMTGTGQAARQQR